MHALEHSPDVLTMFVSTSAERDKAIAALEPDHLPMPVWWDDQDAIAQKQRDRGLPPVCGRRTKYNLPKAYYEKRW